MKDTGFVLYLIAFMAVIVGASFVSSFASKGGCDPDRPASSAGSGR